jgi:EAL domain-containing protein (putative c-di-GMP-specific phosphodiesterase class I)
VSASALALEPSSSEETLRTMRYALDRCIEEGPEAASKSFEAALRQTVIESKRFKEVLQSGRFELVYQPVVDLKTRELHHYEALARFEGGGGPQATIRLAEELGLIVDFDLAIVRGVAAALRGAPPEVSIAANVSGFSLQQAGFVDQVLETTALMPKFRPRLLIEITESHRIIDLEAANEAIQGLREAGHTVCLDDFGAGSASLDYLRRLETDVVKFDGRFVQRLVDNKRDATIVRRTAELCRELGVQTVAEMIETEEVARLVAELGVALGQGWLFGKPVTKPVKLDPPKPIVARRRGDTETWA